MTQETYLNMQHSESVVAGMAATILAAYIQNKEINDANEEAYIKKAAEIAARLADYVDSIVKSDEEWMKKE